MILVKQFTKGLISRIEDKDQARGSASDLLNWHVLGDHIALRRGQKRLGDAVALSTSDVASRVSGLRVMKRYDGVEIPVFSHGRKLRYYDATSDTNIEISSNLLPEAAEGEDIAMSQYNSLAGNFLYISSKNSSFYKLPAANPGSIVDLQSQTYRGKIRIKRARTFLWDRKDAFGGGDQVNVYLSYIDQTENAYQFTSAESLGTGTGAQTTFSGTLAFKANNSKETCFAVVIAAAKQASTAISAISQATAAQVTSNAHGLAVGDTVVFEGITGMTQMNGRIGVVLNVPSVNAFTVNIDSTSFTAYSSGGSAAKCERFIDDKSGNLTGQDGGTGTINYATGAYSVTFNTAVPNSAGIYAQYYREDATNDGVADFTFSTPRTAGQGNRFIQGDNGGKMMGAASFGETEYLLHEQKTWALTITIDDTEAKNEIYRERVGIPNWKAFVETGDGIYYIDAIDKQNPAIRILGLGRFLNEVVPRSISEQLDLSGYEFDRSAMYEWGDYIIVECRTEDSDVNNRTFMYNKTWKSWEIHGFIASDFDTFNGALICGDDGSNNLYKLFTGVADEDAIIENFFVTNNDNLDKEGVKVVNRMKLAGYIGIDQGLKVSYSTDNDPFVEIGGTDVEEPSAEEVTIDSYAESNQNQNSTSIHSGSITQIGQTFPVAEHIRVTLAKFYLKVVGTPTGTLNAKLYAMTGTSGTNGTPTGSVLATSRSVNVSGLTTSYALTEFRFDTPYEIEEAGNYCIVLDATGVSGDGSNHVIAGMDSTSPSHAGNRFTQTGGTYTADATRDYCFYVLGNEYETVHHPLIEGDGSYVDQSQRKVVGSTTLGEEQVGGGEDDEDTIYASPYELEFHVGTARFQRIRLKFEATGVGYASVSEYGFVDIRDKGMRLPAKYVSRP